MTFTNLGAWDRVIRILVGIALAYVTWMTWPASVSIFSWPAIVTLVVPVLGAELIVTGLVGWSPMYALFGFSTTKKIGA